MNIQNESEINALTVKSLRESAKLSQKQFWGDVCVSGARGCAYETGRTSPIPPEIQRLVFLHYVLGFPTDITRKELHEIATVASPVRRARREMSLATSFIDQAGELLRQAKEALNVQP